MKKLIVLFIVMCSFIPLSWAMDGCNQHLSPDEFRAKQKAYITEKAGLTKEEAAKFFPVYFELQDRKKQLNDEAWNLLRKGRDEKTTEAQYNEILEGVYAETCTCLFHICDFGNDFHYVLLDTFSEGLMLVAVPGGFGKSRTAGIQVAINITTAWRRSAGNLGFALAARLVCWSVAAGIWNLQLKGLRMTAYFSILCRCSEYLYLHCGYM